jgi:hypothetical protein
MTNNRDDFDDTGNSRSRQEARPLTDYERGRSDMRDEIIAKLGGYDAIKCAQIAASIPVRRELT